MFRRSDSASGSDSLVLAVRITFDEYRTLQSGGALTATDERRTEVVQFLNKHGFPNPDPFACIAAFIGLPRCTSEWFAYGTITGFLRLGVLDKVEVAASDDIQNGAVNGRPERFRVLSGETSVRHGTVLHLAEEAAANHRTYAECRSGPLELPDFETFDTSGDLSLSLEANLDPGEVPQGRGADIDYVSGDATQPQGVGPRVVVHVCNDIGGWGKGFVMALSKRWPKPEAEYRAWYKSQDGFELGAVQFVQVEDDLWVANLVGQRGLKRAGGVPPIRYDAIRDGLAKVAEFAKEHDASVHMPRIGCGLAGGKWEEVDPVIDETLVAQGVSVTVYDFE